MCPWRRGVEKDCAGSSVDTRCACKIATWSMGQLMRHSVVPLFVVLVEFGENLSDRQLDRANNMPEPSQIVIAHR